MGQFIDITGQRFGRLVALYPTNKRNATNSVIWMCKCDCGNLKESASTTLRRGECQSCGCLHRESLDKIRSTYKPEKTHGGTNDRLYGIWHHMKARCEYPKEKQYHRYGGRGIKVCDEWRNDYGAFREWALANGYDETAKRGECTIDRINNDGDYCPENCRWVDGSTQCNNRANNHYLTYKGKTKTIAEWAKETGGNYRMMYDRVHRGWSDERVIETGIKEGNERLLRTC